MLNLQETIALNNLEHAINNAKETGCDCNGNDCTVCPFRYDGEHGGYDCTIGKMERLLNYITDNLEENNND